MIPRGVTPRDTAATARAATTIVDTTRTAIPRIITGTIAATTRAATPTISRAAASQTAPKSAIRLSRAATDQTDAGAPPPLPDSNAYANCKTAFFKCMDELCANKDTQLRRCACSSRYNEFTAQKKKLDTANTKMLDFSERLLAVGMKKEDATAMNKATEGETAFQGKDISPSQKILDTIAAKLKSSTAAANNISGSGGQIGAVINMTLDVDTAFDNVDSLLGANMTTKVGTDLYRAALPVCHDIAKEICSADDAGIAESAYLMAIEQDCNTVAKAYDTMRTDALAKTRDSAALLEMSRLDAYQTKNADDILTCKKKMLDMLADPSVCGANLEKCLDWSGKYIDPGTGAPFLTDYLYQLSDTLRRPAGGETWAGIAGNSEFVRFLNSKKRYIEPATENCKAISDHVWTEFLEDALPQIKIAQDKKLEDMRQSCTSITTDCLDTSATSVANFDARALSVFGVAADFTVNEICSRVKGACNNLLSHTTGGTDWNVGMTAVASDKTYDTIVKTCLEVGKACIVQNCKNAKGNFGLCEQTFSVNRNNILNGKICWSDVYSCVAAANGAKGSGGAIMEIMSQLGASKDPQKWDGNLYSTTYSGTTVVGLGTCATPGGGCFDGPYPMCDGTTCPGVGATKLTTNCAICRLTERIWGNCELNPTTETATIPSKQNKIITSDTLLSWFAVNTNTVDNPLSCRATECADGDAMTKFDSSGNPLTVPECFPKDLVTSDNQSCAADRKIWIKTDWSNCCVTGVMDSFGNCCADASITTVNQKFFAIPPAGVSAAAYYLSPFTRNSETAGTFNATLQSSLAILATSAPPTATTLKLCAKSDSIQFIATYVESGNTKYLFCVGGTMTGAYDGSSTCSGKYLVVDAATGMYSSPTGGITLSQYFFGDSHTPCTWDGSTWGGSAACNKITGTPSASGNNFFINGNGM